MTKYGNILSDWIIGIATVYAASIFEPWNNAALSMTF
jgi:hypothetical protein